MNLLNNLADMAKKYKVPIVIACIWSFFSEIYGRALGNKYYSIGLSNAGSYVVNKATQYMALVLSYFCAVAIIFFICIFLYKSIVLQFNKEKHIFLYALPVFLILFSLLSAKIGLSTNLENYYQMDERLIWMCAVSRYPFAFVYTSFIYMVSFFIIPVIVAPTIVKVIMCSLIYGYIVYRTREWLKSDLAFLLYGLLLIKPVYQYALEVHRNHWYGWVYLFVSIKIFYDSRNQDNESFKNLLFVEFILCLLTIWRREGIYLLVSGGILLCFTYARLGYRKIIISFLIMEVLIMMPFEFFEKGGMADGDIAWINGFIHIVDQEEFDPSLNPSEMSVLEDYFDMDKVRLYNHDGDGTEFSTYFDSYWANENFKDGKYYLLNPETTVGINEVKRAIAGVILKQPGVFIQSRLRTMGIAFYAEDSYNLWLPFYLVILIFVYSLIKREWILLFLSSGVLAHTTATILTMPATYYKYFYVLYLFSYFIASILLLERLCKSKYKI